MKYLFKFLWAIVLILAYPFVAAWAWLILYGDRAWCIFWHLGHYWIDQYSMDDLNGPGRIWGKACHRCNKIVKFHGYQYSSLQETP